MALYLVAYRVRSSWTLLVVALVLLMTTLDALADLVLRQTQGK